MVIVVIAVAGGGGSKGRHGCGRRLLTCQETTADTDEAELGLLLLLLLISKVNDVQVRGRNEEEAVNEKVDTPSGAWSTGGEAK